MDINTNFKVIAGNNVAEEKKDKIYDDYRFKWHNYPEKKIVNAFPLFLDLEATSICNLKCPHCIQTHTTFKKGFMGWDLYERIIDEATANGCYGCKYNTLSRGEPLLHKNLSKMISYAKKKGMIDVYFNTNGILLTEELSIKLLESGLDRISFSIDGHDEETYAINRANDNFKKVEQQILKFKQIRDKRKYATKIRIQTVELDNIDLEKYKEKWGNFCDDIGIVSFKEVAGRKYGLKSDWVCPQPWQRMSVLFDGSLLPCNHDDRELAALGQFPDISIRKAWYNMAYIREVHGRGDADLIDACDGCILRTSEIEKEK